MLIQKMFREDVFRNINGVIKVDQDDDGVIEQEVKEYVVTKELMEHFARFFKVYSESFEKPTADIGVWISGFYGSGKSHFLKMLSYILENRTINGMTTVERFRQKFEENTEIFEQLEKVTRAKTETILFNIDIQSLMEKDDKAFLRVITKVFYNHLGYYGEDLKVAMLEKHIAQCGKTEAFRRVIENKKGITWANVRKAYTIYGKAISTALSEVLDIDAADAEAWINDKTMVNYSIAQFVEDVNEYIDSKPAGFRLIFLIDEVEQYIGENKELLLNLQSIVERMGSECHGKAWMICTGQTGIDDIIKARNDEFSRIHARFKTRLTLTSSSVDEVIQKRLLRKTDVSSEMLRVLYHENESVLRNLFTFMNVAGNITGYANAQEFSNIFPFVSYQFIIMPKVIEEIRRQGNAGKNISCGERSMISVFHETSQILCNEKSDEYALVPLYLFYDTTRNILDITACHVIERCQNVADEGREFTAFDVKVLELLYLLRYVESIPSTIDNIAILMADDIRTDIITLRSKVFKSLERLLKRNYISQSVDCYYFLTDEEQDIQREIMSTPIEASSLCERISQLIYGEIYTTKKIHYHSDFEFDKLIDNQRTRPGKIALRFLTDATEKSEKSDLQLMLSSKGQAVVVLDEQYRYSELLEKAMKIRKYVKQRNLAQLPMSVQSIIRKHMSNADRNEAKALDMLKKAIETARIFVDCEPLMVKGELKSKIDQTLKYLISHIYRKLELVTKNFEKDSEIIAILHGTLSAESGNNIVNARAIADIWDYLEMQSIAKRPVSMQDIQSRYQGIPYGWREIDIAAAIARLIYDQKVTVEYDGKEIGPAHPSLVSMLRKKRETGHVIVSKRECVTATNIRSIRDFLREYFVSTSIPDDENEIVKFMVDSFELRKQGYIDLLNRYHEHHYPDEILVQKSISQITTLLSNSHDNIRFIQAVLDTQDDLLDNRDDMECVETFFSNQVQVFDKAICMLERMTHELDYLKQDQETYQALERIREITTIGERFNYKLIPNLNSLMCVVKEGHNRLLIEKRKSTEMIMMSCLEFFQLVIQDDVFLKPIKQQAEAYYMEKKRVISSLESLALLDAIKMQMLDKKDALEAQVKAIIDSKIKKTPEIKANRKKQDKTAHCRQLIFPKAHIEDEKDIENYATNICKILRTYLKDGNSIDLT